MEAIKIYLISWLDRIHVRIFGHLMGEQMRQFLSHLSWSLIGGTLASVIMFCVTLLAGRLLGPEQYGRYNELLSLATAFSVIFLFGMNISSVRYLSDKTFAEKRNTILATTLYAVMAWSLLVILFIGATHTFWTDRLSVTTGALFLSLALAIIIALKSMFDGFLRSFHRIRAQSSLRFGEALLILMGFGALVILLNRPDYLSQTIAMIFGGTFFVLFAFVLLQKNLAGHNFDKPTFVTIFRDYNRFLLISSVLAMAIAADRFLIGKLIGVRELGIYGAYYSASHLIISELGALFMNVFWPTVIKNVENLPRILRKTTKLFIGFSPVWIALIMVNTWIFVLLFGSQYPMRADYIALFSVNTFLGLLFSVYIGFLNIHYVSRTVLANIFFTVLSIGTLVVSHSITAYLVSQILAQIITIGVIHRYLSSKSHHG